MGQLSGTWVRLQHPAPVLAVYVMSLCLPSVMQWGISINFAKVVGKILVFFHFQLPRDLLHAQPEADRSDILSDGLDIQSSIAARLEDSVRRVSHAGAMVVSRTRDTHIAYIIWTVLFSFFFSYSFFVLLLHSSILLYKDRSYGKI